MKKTLIIALVVVVLMLTACSKSNAGNGTTKPGTTAAPVATKTPVATKEPEETSAPTATIAPEESDTPGTSNPADDIELPQDEEITLAGKLAEAFKEEITSPGDMNEAMQRISENEAIEFAVTVFDVQEGYLSGFENDITGFEHGVALAPMIGTIPFVAYIFETDNVEELTATLEDNVRLNWNICTMADEYRIETVGNYVFIVLSPYEI